MQMFVIKCLNFNGVYLHTLLRQKFPGQCLKCRKVSSLQIYISKRDEICVQLFGLIFYTFWLFCYGKSMENFVDLKPFVESFLVEILWKFCLSFKLFWNFLNVNETWNLYFKEFPSLCQWRFLHLVNILETFWIEASWIPSQIADQTFSIMFRNKDI